MKNHFTLVLLIILGLFWQHGGLRAQNEEAPSDDLGEVSDAFQEHFFEALKQKGIENYELAIIALNKAQIAAGKDQSNLAVVDFEMGKNLAKLEKYQEAEIRYKQVLERMGERLDVLEALYEVYYQQRNYEAAIPLVEKLIKYDSDYKEDLANLYNYTKQYEKALMLLDELDDNLGDNSYRDALRRQIYKVTGNTDGAISNLEEKIEKNPKKEQDYLNLIFLYSEQGDSKKAFETARELLKQQPDSKLVHLALYKYYLEEGNAAEAIKSMDIVFDSSQIDIESKYKVLGDFIVYVNENEGYEDKLEHIVNKFSSENSGQVYEKIGLYFIGKGQKDKALKFYEIGVTKDPDNYSLLKNTLLLQLDFKRYKEASKLSSDALEIFPAQALLYLINGVSQNQLANYKDAIYSLESGLDYLIDDLKMEKDFYEQLSIAYDKKGDALKSSSYRKKASEINISN